MADYPIFTTAKKAVFLDRDGTINVEKNYLYLIEDFEFIPGAPEAIKRLKDAGFLVVVVTNQSGVARGYYTLEDVDRLHDYLQSELARYDTSIDAFYVCPHYPTVSSAEYCQVCACRKPEPGMLLQAAVDLDIGLDVSYLVGDKPADLQAAKAAGCIPILVRTGYGQKVAERSTLLDCKVFDSIIEATDYILEKTDDQFMDI